VYKILIFNRKSLAWDFQKSFQRILLSYSHQDIGRGWESSCPKKKKAVAIGGTSNTSNLLSLIHPFGLFLPGKVSRKENRGGGVGSRERHYCQACEGQ